MLITIIMSWIAFISGVNNVGKVIGLSVIGELIGWAMLIFFLDNQR